MPHAAVAGGSSQSDGNPGAEIPEPLDDLGAIHAMRATPHDAGVAGRERRGFAPAVHPRIHPPVVPSPLSSRHPWESLAPSTRVHLLRRTTIVTVGLTFLMQKIGRPLVSPEAPHGIVSFELARTAAKAQRIVATWSPAQQGVAWQGLMLDFAYLFAYGMALSLACALAADWWRPRDAGLARVTVMLAWASLVAAGLDVVENLALMLQLRGADAGVLAPLAYVAASVKFTLVAVALLAIVVAAFARLARRSPVGPSV